ncbi:glycosyltransferase family A protein [Nitratireductor sp. GISD-1A_MAKvit]|uniref:glycosyltransferase family 2 protein n=1 Tax=Nitratireductor sp. GISD-1A_MAKvit TaxID=3234198 RepID=UPI0034671468
MRCERTSFALAKTRVAVGIATTGRRAILRSVLPHLTRQSRLPDEVVICAADVSDVDCAALGGLEGRTRVVLSEKGLCRQRNRILDCTEQTDILLFLDDDFLAAPSYLAEMADLFERHPEVVMTTGVVDADGILGPGIPLDEGLQYLGKRTSADPAPREQAGKGTLDLQCLRMQHGRSHVDRARLRFAVR